MDCIVDVTVNVSSLRIQYNRPVYLTRASLSDELRDWRDEERDLSRTLVLSVHLQSSLFFCMQNAVSNLLLRLPCKLSL